MGNLKQNLLKMMNLLKYAGAASLSSLDDCPWEDAAYYRYGLFNAANTLMTDSDSCKVLSYMEAIIADLDNSKDLDRCEFSLMCIGTHAWGTWEGELDDETGEGYEELGTWCAEKSMRVDGEMIEEMCEKNFD